MVLHAAIFRAASLATPLRDMLHESLQRVTPLATVKIDAKLAATNVAESRIGFYFSQRLQQLFFSIAACNTPFNNVSYKNYKYNTIEKKMRDKVEKTSINETTLKSFWF